MSSRSQWRTARSLALCLIVAGSMGAPSPQAQSAGPQGSWSTKAPLPIKIAEVAVAAVGGKIYALGGTTEDVVDQRLNQEGEKRNMLLFGNGFAVEN